MTTPVLFLDDASRFVGIADKALAEQLVMTLLNTLISLRKVNKRFALNTAVPIAQYEVAEGWTLQKLLGGALHRDQWDFIRQLNNRSPIAAEMEDYLLQEVNGMEFRTQAGQVKSAALAWAALLESATVSCDAQPDWKQPWINIEFTKLQDDGNLTDSVGQVRNVSQADHVVVHVDWLKLLGLSDGPSAIQVWQERADRYPGLRFLGRVERDLVTLEGTGAPFRQALSALEALAQAAGNWTAESAWPEFSNADPESATRRQFCWADDDVSGKRECFDWHTRFTGSFHGRVHFRVDEAARKIVVAYIGLKLFRDIPN